MIYLKEVLKKDQSMKKTKLNNSLEISPIVHGYWRLQDWKISKQETLTLMKEAMSIGVSTFDHADIYGGYACEELFGQALLLDKSIRKDIQLITKCGIKLISDKFPETKVKHYDYSYKHIITSVENSLRNLQTDYIDALLLHRPSPFFAPEEVAKAFDQLTRSGKVLHFGASNFTPQQFEMLDSYLDAPLVTNQVEISPYCLEHFDNENMDYFLQKRIKPMAWSPLAGGRLMNPQDKKGHRLALALSEVGNELNIDSIDKVIYAWLIQHPTGIIPIAGTQHISRLQSAVEALSIKMNIEQWSKIYIASLGEELP